MVIDELHLQTVSNIEIPVHSIATIPTKRTVTGTPFIYEVHINETIT